MSQPESKLSRAIMALLRARGCYCVKIHGGPTMAAGTPDILACVPVLFTDETTGKEVIVGTFVGFETKMPGGKGPSPIQEHVHRKISDAYGVVFVPRSVDDVVDALNWLGWVPPDDPRNLDKPSLWHGVKKYSEYARSRRGAGRG